MDATIIVEGSVLPDRCEIAPNAYRLLTGPLFLQHIEADSRCKPSDNALIFLAKYVGD